jgi:hypothetical protein
MTAEKPEGDVALRWELSRMDFDQIVAYVESQSLRIAELEKALRDATDQIARQHSPFNHDYIRDEKACAECKNIARYRRALSSGQPEADHG